MQYGSDKCLASQRAGSCNLEQGTTITNFSTYIYVLICIKIIWKLILAQDGKMFAMRSLPQSYLTHTKKTLP